MKTTVIPLHFVLSETNPAKIPPEKQGNNSYENSSLTVVGENGRANVAPRTTYIQLKLSKISIDTSI